MVAINFLKPNLAEHLQAGCYDELYEYFFAGFHEPTKCKLSFQGEQIDSNLCQTSYGLKEFWQTK